VTAIGIMGGTFDPIHFGHLRAADEVLEGFGLEKVIFVPSGRPPHKPSGSVASPMHRYIMTQLATSDHPHFRVSRVEIDREGTSYTVDTLKALRQQHKPPQTLYFITGLDAILQISTWKNHLDLFDLSDFIAVTRPGYSPEGLHDLRNTLGASRFAKIHFFPITLLDITSTEIRRKVREGKSIRYLVPDPVANFIEKERLYFQDPERRLDTTGGSRKITCRVLS
jgi:nicotinate-nucleotide adenylyltransferase